MATLTAAACIAATPNASAMAVGVPLVSPGVLRGIPAGQDGDQISASVTYNNMNVARYRLHSDDTWLKDVYVVDGNGNQLLTKHLIVVNDQHDTLFMQLPASYFNQNYTLVFRKAKAFGLLSNMFQIPLINDPSSGDPLMNPVGKDTFLNWYKW
ncbi:hypothetical protein [Streptomyces sp. NPDC058701]|uniref:hypothetical protein n=1 Tax=Streptomyces sp. NPDC058701 TaxID=3346608 RepID=UPI0036569040